jgi:hypothetical protein
VAPKIFNTGPNWAGTTALARAPGYLGYLGYLGYRMLHFRSGSEGLFAIARASLRAGQLPVPGLARQYDAVSDVAGQLFSRDLDHQDPGSTFILTTRGPGARLDSRGATPA